MHDGSQAGADAPVPRPGAPGHGTAPGAAAPDPAPHNIEAEQALLGALLVNNEVYDRVENRVAPEDFFEPVHGRIFEVMAARLRSGALASPITLRPFLAADEGLGLLGGPSYLQTLADAAISVYAARDYADLIQDLALRRRLIEVGQGVISRATTVTTETPPGEQIVAAEQELYGLATKGRTERGFQSLLKAATDAVGIASAAYERDGSLAGLATGLTDLDRKLGGLHPSDLLILAARPSMGKTSLATNIAFHIARQYRSEVDEHGATKAADGGIVGFFNLEMSAEQLAARMLSEAAEIPSENIRRGDMTEDEFRRFVEAARAMETLPLYIDDTPALTIAQVAARARRLKRTHGLDCLFIDYLQLLRPATAKDSRVNEVSEITQGLKAIAKELNIPVVALSQLSRQVENREDKRPQLSDLRESGSIEQDADVVMFIFREEYYREREKPSEHDAEAMLKWQQDMERVHAKAEVIIGKQRHGPIGTVELSFESQYTRFGNLARQRDDGF